MEANRLYEMYKTKIVPKLQSELNLSSVMEVPKIEKIVINSGAGDAVKNNKVIDDVINELSLIAGQKALVTIAKKSIAGFKLRQGMKIGAKVTLRGNKMWIFLEKLIRIALPRVRDFRGLSLKSFDGHGNYSLGIKEQIIFVEIDYDKIKKIRGMDIAIITSAKTDKEAKLLLKNIGLPFVNKNRGTN